MEIKTFIIIWLLIIAVCALEAYFSVPYDTEFEKEYKKRINKKTK